MEVCTSNSEVLLRVTVPKVTHGKKCTRVGQAEVETEAETGCGRQGKGEAKAEGTEYNVTKLKPKRKKRQGVSLGRTKK